MWDDVGMSRSDESLKRAIVQIRALREEFWQNVNVAGTNDFNKELEFAGRVADYLELGELMAMDALLRNESCGGHFREEFQYPDGEAKRDDENYSYVAAWKHNGAGQEPSLVKEPLVFEHVKPAQRSYK
jgi:succinate dehydrogenase / fumarate reductase flavoprotein subunit